MLNSLRRLASVRREPLSKLSSALILPSPRHYSQRRPATMAPDAPAAAPASAPAPADAPVAVDPATAKKNGEPFNLCLAPPRPLPRALDAKTCRDLQSRRKRPKLIRRPSSRPSRPRSSRRLSRRLPRPPPPRRPRPRPRHSLRSKTTLPPARRRSSSRSTTRISRHITPRPSSLRGTNGGRRAASSSPALRGHPSWASSSSLCRLRT